MDRTLTTLSWEDKEMIEIILGLSTYVIPLYSLMFLLYFLIGNLSKTTHSPKILLNIVIFLSLIALFVAGLSFQFGIALFGYIVGRNIKVKEETIKKVLKYCLVVSLGVSAFDLIYNSGLYDLRFLRYPSFLFDNSLIYYLLVGTILTSITTAIVYNILFFLFIAVTRISRASIVILLFVTYIIESKIHENIYHPYWIHHPDITVITMSMFIFGWWFSSSNVFDEIKKRNSRFDLWIISTLYFVLYHAIIEIYEKGSSSMFGTDYLMVCVLISTITLVFGAYCKAQGVLFEKSN